MCKRPSCKTEGCNTQPNFNIEGDTKALYCKNHKQIDMVNVISPTCKTEGCKTRPNFNKEGETKGLYCKDHKQIDMVNVISLTCKNNWCNTHVANKYEGYCLRCFMYLNPDKPIARNYKTKERAVVDFILQYFPNFTWYCDKKIPDGCSKRRPDLFVDMGNIVIIIEIDENQHTDYSSTCEEARINNISMDLNNRQVVMIRFNPDEYQDKEEKVKSCWGTNKFGICVITKKKINEWNNRLKTLKENIEPFLNPGYNQDEPLKIINLFYDEN